MSTIGFAAGGGSGEGFAEYDFERADVFAIGKNDEESSYAQGTESINLSERIIEQVIKEHMISTIDKVIHVKTLSKPERDQRVAFWASKQSTMNWSAAVFGTASIACGAVGMMGSGGFFIAAAVAGVVTILSLVRSSEAGSQKEKWSQDHVAKVADMRAEAFNNGFGHVLLQDQNSSNAITFKSILTRKELVQMYDSFFSRFNERAATACDKSAKLNLMRLAVEYGPLSAKAINYAGFFEEEKARMALYREGYQNFVQAYGQIDRHIAQQGEAARESARQATKEVRGKEQELLKGIEKQYQTLKKQIQKTTDSQLGREIKTGEDIEGNNDRYIKEGTKAMEEARKNFLETKENALKPFREQIKLIENKRDEFLQLMRRDREIFLLPLYDQMLQLHREGYKTYMGGKGVYTPYSYEQNLPHFTPPPFNPPVNPFSAPLAHNPYGMQPNYA